MEGRTGRTNHNSQDPSGHGRGSNNENLREDSSSWKYTLEALLMTETSLMELYTTIALFKRQPHKIAKHTQKINRLLPTNCLSVLNHFVGLALKGLKNGLKIG